MAPSPRHTQLLSPDNPAAFFEDWYNACDRRDGYDKPLMMPLSPKSSNTIHRTSAAKASLLPSTTPASMEQTLIAQKSTNLQLTDELQSAQLTIADNQREKSQLKQRLRDLQCQVEAHEWNVAIETATMSELAAAHQETDRKSAELKVEQQETARLRSMLLQEQQLRAQAQAKFDEVRIRYREGTMQRINAEARVDKLERRLREGAERCARESTQEEHGDHRAAAATVGALDEDRGRMLNAALTTWSRVHSSEAEAAAKELYGHSTWNLHSTAQAFVEWRGRLHQEHVMRNASELYGWRCVAAALEKLAVNSYQSQLLESVGGEVQHRSKILFPDESIPTGTDGNGDAECWACDGDGVVCFDCDCAGLCMCGPSGICSECNGVGRIVLDLTGQLE